MHSQLLKEGRGYISSGAELGDNSCFYWDVSAASQVRGQLVYSYWFSRKSTRKSWRCCRGLAVLEAVGVLTALLLLLPPLVSIGVAAIHQQRLEAVVEQLVHPSALGNVLVRRAGSFTLAADKEKLAILCRALATTACEHMPQVSRESCYLQHGARVSVGEVTVSCGGRRVAPVNRNGLFQTINRGSSSVELLEVHLQGLPASVFSTGWWNELIQVSDLAGVQRIVPLRGEVVWG